MKKLKLIFGLLIVAAFFGSSIISLTSSDNEQAIKKSRFQVVKRLP